VCDLGPARRALMCCLTVVITIVAFSPNAWGHAAFQGSEPEPGSRLNEPPARVVVSYSEPPVTQSSFAVLDGCGNEVSTSFEVLNQTIEAPIGESQPGRWRVEWSVISAVDGHLTRDNVFFTVKGERDCSQAAPESDGSRPGDGGSLVPIVIASVVIVVIAAVVRFATR
jgi:methionine-rich copper-binding protein CopC